VAAIGIHLPQLVERPSAAAMAEAVDCAVAAERLGFAAVSVNDHVVYRSPWLDGPALLAAAAARTTTIGLATTVLLPALRGAAFTARTVEAVHLLSGGRLVAAGVGVGSHSDDHAACGVPFERRGAALEAAVIEMRALCPSGLPIWIASWGADVGLRRAARLGDGWMASALAAGPAGFAERWQRVRDLVAAEGRDPDTFGNLVATLFFYVDDDRQRAERVIAERIGPMVGRPDLLAHCAVGTADDVAERIQAYADAGGQRIHLWPAADPLEQIDALAGLVLSRA
jgi:alkanesulfonate monooxygenase SsuD/methylene tetrahydromethanopterin reductase-like flavin-dependent oxidoreductase (luciferase family)